MNLSRLIEIGVVSPKIRSTTPIILNLAGIRCVSSLLSRGTKADGQKVSEQKSKPAPTKPAGAAPTPKKMAPAKEDSVSPTPEKREVKNALGTPKVVGTTPLWLQDTYRFTATAKIISVERTEKGSLCVVLDQSIFHPQGGGQPSDKGFIQDPTNQFAAMEMSFASMDRSDGIVKHDCVADSCWDNAAGKEVKLVVDEEMRRLNARCHSAGHLLDVAVSRAGYMWVPAKGYHFTDGSYVCYDLTPELKSAFKKEEAMESVQREINKIFEEDSEVLVGEKDGMRTVTMNNVSCGCGGTHVKKISDIKGVTVKGMKMKGVQVRVSYTIA